MGQFLPDAESITEYFGEFEARGLRFEVAQVPRMGYVLRMVFGPGSDVTPLFPLPAAKMQSAEAAADWMQHLRDNQLRQFNYLLER